MLKVGKAVSQDGCQLAFSVLGPASRDKIPLLMIGGWTMSQKDWGKPILKALSESRQVIVMDNRGMGNSDVPTSGFSIDNFAKDCKSVCDEIGLDKVSVLGVSLGSMIAQEFWKQNKDFTKAVVLGCATHGGKTAVLPPADFFTSFAKWNSAPVEEKKEIAEGFMKYMLSEDWIKANPEFYQKILEIFKASDLSIDGVNGQLQALSRFNSTKWISEMESIPTLILQGDLDRVIDIENARLIHSKIKGSQLDILKGHAHMWWLTAEPNYVKERVDTLLKEI